VLKKNQGSVKKRNPKGSTSIKPSHQDSRISGTKGSWFEEDKSRERYFRSTMLQLSKVWSLQESLSRAKEKEGETRSINCRRKGTYKED